MALMSCYSNWGELEQYLNSELIMTTFLQPQSAQLSPDRLLEFNLNFAVSDPYMDYSILESQDFFNSDSLYSSLLPYFSSPSDEKSTNDLYSIIPEAFQEVEYELYPNSKRQKNFEGCYNNTEILQPSFCNRFIPNPPLLHEEILTLFPESFADNPPDFSSEKSGDATTDHGKKGSNEGTLSAQSIAARQRRRKITEKTQELGKLIPGGQKMNTAEMFQAAFKYIKFLQAQVGILETVDSSVRENGESFQNQELSPLLASSLLQEKLYSMEKCLVPQKFIQSLADDDRVQSNSQALNDFKELIDIGG